MDRALGRAEKWIHPELFQFEGGRIGRRFADALAHKARAGVRVRVLYDWVGSLLVPRSFWCGLRRAGVEVRVVNPPAAGSPLRVFERDHRKLFAVDGRYASTGGASVADRPLAGALPGNGAALPRHLRRRPEPRGGRSRAGLRRGVGPLGGAAAPRGDPATLPPPAAGTGRPVPTTVTFTRRSPVLADVPPSGSPICQDASLRAGTTAEQPAPRFQHAPCLVLRSGTAKQYTRDV